MGRLPPGTTANAAANTISLSIGTDVELGGKCVAPTYGGRFPSRNQSDSSVLTPIRSGAADDIP